MKIKKLLYITAFFTLLFSFLATLPIQVLAYTENVDQENVNINSGYDIGIGASTKVGQTFQPSVNTLTKIYVPLNDAKGSINVVVRDSLTNASMGAVVRSFPTKISGVSWQAFTFSSPLTLSTSKKYIIRVTGGQDTDWVYGANTYSKGNTVLYPPDGTTVDLNLDMGFKTYGYNSIVYIPGGIQPPNISGSTGQSQSTDTGTNTTSPGGSTSSEEGGSSVGTENSSSASPAESAKLPVDESIVVPTLTYVVKNNDIMDMSGKSELNVSTKDKLKILGKAPAGMRVMLFIGQTVLSNKANENGDWNVSLESAVLKEGSYAVEAQTQGLSGKGSRIVKFFDLKTTEGILGDLLSKEKRWLLYSLAGAGVVVIILGGTGFYFWRKSRKKKTILKKKGK